MFYFEVTVMSVRKDDNIAVGLVGGEFPMNKQPGTEVMNILTQMLSEMRLYG